MSTNANANLKPRMFLLIGIVALCLVAAAGCAVGPDYRKPETKVPDNWNGQEVVPNCNPSKTTPDPAALVEWWQAFNDPSLSALVEMAVRANLDLRLAEARIRQARAALGVAGGAFWPVVDARPPSMNGATGSIASIGPSEADPPAAELAALREAYPPRALQLRRFGNYFRWVWMPHGKWIFSGAPGGTSRPPGPISGPRWRTTATS